MTEALSIKMETKELDKMAVMMIVRSNQDGFVQLILTSFLNVKEMNVGILDGIQFMKNVMMER